MSSGSPLDSRNVDESRRWAYGFKQFDPEFGALSFKQETFEVSIQLYKLSPTSMSLKRVWSCLQSAPQVCECAIGEEFTRKRRTAVGVETTVKNEG